MEHQALEESRPPEPNRNVDYHSDWGVLEDVKDDQTRAKPVDIQDPQPSTSYANESAPLRCPNTYPKVLNLGGVKGKGKMPLANWTSVVKGQGCRIIIDQIPQEPERNLAIVAPTDEVVHMDSVQTYEADPTPTRPRVS